MKILLAVDGSECSQAAVASVAERPWPPASTIKIVSAIESPFVPAPEAWSLPNSYYSQAEEAAEQQALQTVTEAAEKLADKQLEIQTEVLPGQAREVILTEAEKWHADLIILGSHGYTGWQRFWLGSVSHAVAAHAPCSVEIVR